MKIKQMPDILANKIAAGEVVERPASVVKELVENSIDANSKWIKIELEEAGLQKIKIIDDGEGMDKVDAEHAFLRHATSKIKNETDLFHVKTLGFRGEALASIASVCRLTIKTSEGKQAGTFLKLEGGKLIEKKKSDARRGTEITVNDLFFNTPARLKYMKTIHTELGHITDLLNRLALSHPEIRFEAIHNGKGLFRTTGSGDILQVISQIYGMNTAKKMLPIEKETLDFSISGFIAKPEITRASRNYITTIINGRYIKSIPLSQAIIRGYHTLLPIGRNPIVVLNIEMDPILVDVNVHPTKLEVRFSKDKELFTEIEQLIRNKFREISLIPEMEQKPKQKEKTFQATLNFDNSKEVKSDFNDIISSEKQTYPINPSLTTDTSSKEIENQKEIINERQPEAEFHSNAQENQKENDGSVQMGETDNLQTNNQRIPTMYPIGQLQGTYILAQNENGLYMIDQHAAQERIKYEFFKEKLGKPMNQLQELLLPMTFEFSKQESIFIEQYKEELEKVGLFLEKFGNQTYVIRSHPSWFPDGFEEEVIREMIDQIMTTETVNIESIRESASILMSCKRSIKANHYLSNDEMFRLLEDLRQTADPFTCPHGRPIIVHFSTYELEKMFKRVM